VKALTTRKMVAGKGSSSQNAAGQKHIFIIETVVTEKQSEQIREID